jgi:hypothetical protein
MKCSRNQVKEQIVDLGGIVIGNVQSFKYLGSVVSTNITIEEEIKERISAGNKAYFAHKMLFVSKTFSKKSKLKLYNSVIRPIVTYTSRPCRSSAVRRWLPTAAARVRVRAACGVCVGQSGTGVGFLRVLRFPLPIIPSTSPLS